MARFTGVLGMLVILAGAYLFSTSRKSIQLKTVLWGLGLQLTLGYFVLRSAFVGFECVRINRIDVPAMHGQEAARVRQVQVSRTFCAGIADDQVGNTILIKITRGERQRAGGAVL